MKERKHYKILVEEIKTDRKKEIIAEERKK